MSISKFVRCCLLFIAIASSGGTLQADNSAEVSGQVRARFEIDKKSFHPNAAAKSLFGLRTRLATHFLIDNNTHFFAQLQDSRRLGGQNSMGEDQSGTLNDSRNVDIHQAYVKIDELWQDGIGLQLGRFEVNLGNQRVFGSVGWHNVGRSWEGAHGFMDRSRFDVSGYWLKRREVNDPGENRDFDIVGINMHLKNYGSEFLFFGEHDADRSADEMATAIDRLNRMNIAVYSKRTYDPVDLEMNAVYQFGQQRASRGDTVFSEQDISAILITFEAGYMVDSERDARVAVGFDYSSGDEDPSDGTYEAYDNLYYTGHKFRGYMDYFVGSNAEGLFDLMARGRISPAQGWLLQADVHYFRTDQEYVGSHDETSKNIGGEIDLGLSTTTIPGVAFTCGGSVFFPDNAYAGEENDPGLWLYTMFTAGF
ncbi:MAG: alginate export family protein [Candidatus Latescibacterota bacterium]